MAGVEALTDKKYTVIGRRYGSDEMAAQGVQAAGRWSRDVAVLARYGHGQAELDAFNALREQHAVLRIERPEAVTAKALTVQERAARLVAARHWVNQVSSLLGSRARADAALAQQVNDALPADDAGLDASIGTLSKLLTEHAARFAADAGVPECIAEAEAVRAGLTEIMGSLATAKSATRADTAEIDLLDGRLYISIRDLNRAARRAIRAGKLNAATADYRFDSGAARKAPAPAATPVA
jgi:hypothetical protein